MTTDRPTKEITTSGGHKIVLNEYITGAENWAIRQVYIKGIRAGTEAESQTKFEAEKLALGIVVVSIDGKTNNVADEILRLPLNQYREVTDEVTPIVEGKKKSQTS